MWSVHVCALAPIKLKGTKLMDAQSSVLRGDTVINIYVCRPRLGI